MKQIYQTIDCTNGHTPFNDIERGEQVCQACGQVLEEKIADTSFDPCDIVTHMNVNLGQTTIMSKDLTSVPRSERFNMLKLKKMDNMIRYDSNGKEKSRIERINNLCEKLQLPEHVRIDFIQLATKARNERLTRGRVINEMDAAIAMYLCKRHGIPKPMKTVASAIGISVRKIWRPLRLITETYGEQNIVPEIESYIPQFISQANMTEIHAHEAKRMLSVIKKTSKHEGKSPIVLLAAILLTVSRKSGNHHITQAKMAELVGISSMGIKLMIKKLSLNTI